MTIQCYKNLIIIIIIIIVMKNQTVAHSIWHTHYTEYCLLAVQ